jgi:hypothetical protein
MKSSKCRQLVNEICAAHPDARSAVLDSRLIGFNGHELLAVLMALIDPDGGAGDLSQINLTESHWLRCRVIAWKSLAKLKAAGFVRPFHDNSEELKAQADTKRKEKLLKMIQRASSNIAKWQSELAAIDLRSTINHAPPAT